MGSPEFDNKSDKLIKLFWIGNNGQEKWMCDLHPGAHRPPSSWHAYPRVGCWVAKEGDKELLRVSSTTVVEYGFQFGGEFSHFPRSRYSRPAVSETSPSHAAQERGSRH